MSSPSLPPVMSSPGLLFLLLMSSCLPVLSAPPDTSPDEGQLESHGGHLRDMFKKFGDWFKNNYKGIGEVLVANLESMPIAGQPIAGGIKTLLLLAPEADPLDIINSEIRGLSLKLDTNRAELKWDAWAAGAYQIPMNNIEKAWVKYTEFVRSYQQTADTEKEALRSNFFTSYSLYADSTLVLHQFLTAKPASITPNLGDLLAQRLRCHENDIKAQFLHLNELMCKGNMLDEKYHEFKGTNTKARVNAALTIASQSASALMTSHQRCISGSDAYIEMDIFERIDDTKKHQEIADDIRAFLVKTYDRYDWMVVAFTTLNSKHRPRFLKRHVLSGFSEVQRGSVTVAVAKQVKGGHTKTADVIKAIERCIPKTLIVCGDVVKKLTECQVTIFGKPLSQMFTAVHAYKRNSQTSGNAAEAPNDDDSELPESSVSLRDSSLMSHLFKGKCGKAFGKYIVLIKSDEEIMGENPCTKKKCGKNGKCVTVPGTNVAMCDCQYPHYGEHCEMSFETYKRQLQQDSESRTQSPGQFERSMSASATNRRSQQSTAQRSSVHRSRESASRSSIDHRPQKSTSRRSSSQRPRKSSSRSSVDSRSRGSTLQRSSSRKSRKSTSRGSPRRKSRKGISRGSPRHRSRKSNSRGSPGRRSRERSSSKRRQLIIKSTPVARI